MLDAAQPFPPDDPPPLRALAFLLPQFHPTPENDAFWGAGFTEWHNVVRARPRFTGHDQPQLPADLGFYDLRLAETRHAQAALARAAGLSGFCWYHYWFGGRRVLHQPFDRLLADKGYDFPFLLCWANENWTRAWDGGAREVILAQRYSPQDTVAHARHLVPALADPRAVRVNGRPAFAVYNTDDLPDARAWSDLFRDTLAAEGIDPYLIRVERQLDRDRRAPGALGFDAALDFQPFSRSLDVWGRTRPELSRRLPARIARRLAVETRRIAPRDTHIDFAAYRACEAMLPAPSYLRFPGVCPAWDNSARRPAGKAIIFRGATPEGFADWVARKTRGFSPPTPGENLLFVNAWNEWAEGCHLEPCLGRGHAWLDALGEGLGASVGAATS